MTRTPRLAVATADYHTGGEPFRIVTGGVPQLRGRTILEKRRDASERLDEVRRLLVFEPRGHADMYGCFVTEPEDDGADLGVVFLAKASVAGRPAVVTEVEGSAYATGRHEFVLDPDDPVGTGFLLR